MATYVLLTDWSARNGLRDVSQVPLKGPVRVFNITHTEGSCSFREISLERGILYNTHPTRDMDNLYAWSQIGSGTFGTCCLATTKSGNACVLKFFYGLYDDVVENAITEMSNWQYLYKDQNWAFISIHKMNRTCLLVMPYLHVPKDKEAREELLDGREQSLLWKGLTAFAKKERQHDDLKWQHVGFLMKESPANSKRQKGNEGEKVANAENAAVTVKEVILFDLGSVSDLAPEDAIQWVEKSFDMLKACSDTMG